MPRSRRPRSLWARWSAVDERQAADPRGDGAAGFRDLIVALADDARPTRCRSRIGKMLDRTGYLQSLRDERSEEAEERIENLMELVSAAREYESREADATLGGFVDRLSLLSEADEESGAKQARVWLMSMHAAKGLEFPVVIVAGMEEGLFPHSRSAESEDEIEEERRLCYVCMTARERAGPDQRGAAPGVRRVPGHRAVALPRRDSGGTGRARRHPAFSSPPGQPRRALRDAREPVRPRRGRSGGARQGRRARATRYEDEDQSAMASAPGMRVRHAQFGVGTVLAVEEHGDDHKITVRFNSRRHEEAAREIRQAGTRVGAGVSLADSSVTTEAAADSERALSASS